MDGVEGEKMTREERIQLIRALNGAIDVNYLESLPEDQLDSYLVHLKAVRLRSINDRRQRGMTASPQQVA